MIKCGAPVPQLQTIFHFKDIYKLVMAVTVVR